MARPRTKGKHLSMGIDQGIVGWCEYRGLDNRRGQAGYINDLVWADRAQADPETMRRYRLYLEARGYGEELSSLDSGAEGVAQA